MNKLTIICVALAVVIGTSLEADAQDNLEKRQARRGNANQTQHFGQFPWKPPKWKDPAPAPQPPPQPKPAPRQNGLTFKNYTNKHIVIYVYKPNDNFRTFTWHEVRIQPRGTASWPQADDNYNQLWLKGMEIGSLHVVAPEKKIGSTNVIGVYQNVLKVERRR